MPLIILVGHILIAILDFDSFLQVSLRLLYPVLRLRSDRSRTCFGSFQFRILIEIQSLKVLYSYCSSKCTVHVLNAPLLRLEYQMYCTGTEYLSTVLIPGICDEQW